MSVTTIPEVGHLFWSLLAPHAHGAQTYRQAKHPRTLQKRKDERQSSAWWFKPVIPVWENEGGGFQVLIFLFFFSSMSSEDQAGWFIMCGWKINMGNSPIWWLISIQVNYQSLSFSDLGKQLQVIYFNYPHDSWRPFSVCLNLEVQNSMHEWW